MRPKISVIIPVYNATKTINRCLESIFAQTFKDFEVIVVNDGSTDNSLTLLRRRGGKIKLFTQTNRGAPAARNLGFRQSRGEYVIFCDADIIMKPDMLEKMNDALDRNRQATYVYSSFRFGWKKFRLWPYDFTKLKKLPYIHTTSLLRREFFPGWDETLTRFQDWDLWLTIGERGGKGEWLNKVLFSVKPGGTMSRWLPRWLYHLPGLKSVKEYRRARAVIKRKHNVQD